MDTYHVTLGFVPSYRFGWTAWTQKMRDESLEAFNSLSGAKIVVPRPGPEDNIRDAQLGYSPHGAVSGLDDAEVIAEYFLRQKIDGLVLCPLDFGDERSASKIAEKLKVPVLLYATKEPPAPDTVHMGRVSDSYCGNLSMASGLYRRKISFHYAGLFFPDESPLLSAVQDFVRAVAVVKSLQGARIGQVGVRPATFETVGYDEVAMIRNFQQNVIYTNLADITNQAQRYDNNSSDVIDLMEEIRQDYAEVTVSDKYLRNAAKLELALSKFWMDNKLSAMAVQCWPSVQRLMGISVCNLYGRLTGKGMLTACEADVLGSLAMLTNYSAALHETLPHFIDWTALRSRRDMQGANPVPEDDPQAGLAQFQIKPGKVTFCRLTEYDDQWKMLIATGEIIPSDETLAGTWSWVAVKDHEKLYRTLVEEGFIHHASMIHGDQTKALLLACKYLDIKPVLVE
jgi:L-fucose isomerase-like protein